MPANRIGYGVLSLTQLKYCRKGLGGKHTASKGLVDGGRTVDGAGELIADDEIALLFDGHAAAKWNVTRRAQPLQPRTPLLYSTSLPFDPAL